ncbi:hypothetical protein INT44_002934 [Umbelopsis vinacea]|uniref:Uncharacterized protein n=1 Tax=Umbelopsis vinacea TaxID=44442 RepID=A0A8H7Q6D2_9FUNG|nr:hypothetical protein INT44_002934 [Umbelopsis vinacea]
MVPSLSSIFFKISTVTNKSLNRRRSQTSSVDTASTGSKSVHFKDFVETYDCYSPTEYDRRPSTEIDEFWQPTSISPVVERDEIDEEADPAYVKLVEKNTKINQKVGHHSMAVLISYRSIR